jgi:arabinofuranosyltransferase
MTDNAEIPDRSAAKRNARIFTALLVAAVAVGVVRAAQLSFVNDDAFISFRYAKNLAGGLGLVFNAGERVEGYTNFLWTLLMALGIRLGLDPVPFSTTLGILFCAGTLLVVGAAGRVLRRDKESLVAALPFASLALCLHRDFNAYSTSGMETSMATFFAAAAFGVLLLGRKEISSLAAGALLLLGMLTRPDGVLFFLASLIYLLVAAPNPARRCLLLAAPSVLVFLPYWLWRSTYYGYFFPNTFYAKSVDLPYYSQGITYTLLYFKTYYGLIVLGILMGCVALWKALRSTGGGPPPARSAPGFRSSSPHPVLLASLWAGLFTLFIIRIGGDFMFARFFIPMTPVIYMALDSLLAEMRGRLVPLVLGGLLVLTTGFRNDQFGHETQVGYIADEQRYYTEERLKESREHGEMLHSFFGNLPVRVAFWAGQLTLIYYADPPYALESSAGLTDTTIAHLRLESRGRPGHEKQAAAEYLMQRKIHFFFGPMEPPPRGQAVLNAAVFGTVLARLIIYDNAVMVPLSRNPAVHFIRMPEYLDSYIKEMPQYPLQKVQQDYQYFRAFYFQWNSDTTRERAILSSLLAQGGGGISPDQ